MFETNTNRYTPEQELTFLRHLQTVALPDKFAQVVALVQTREYPGWTDIEQAHVYNEAVRMCK